MKKLIGMITTDTYPTSLSLRGVMFSVIAHYVPVRRLPSRLLRASSSLTLAAASAALRQPRELGLLDNDTLHRAATRITPASSSLRSQPSCRAPQSLSLCSLDGVHQKALRGKGEGRAVRVAKVFVAASGCTDGCASMKIE